MDSSLDAIATAIENATTPQQQLNASDGLPLVWNSDTGRYSLAPTAHLALRYRQQNTQQTFNILPLTENKLYLDRVQRAAERAAAAENEKQ